MTAINQLQDELDEYEGRLGDIGEVLENDALSPDEQLEAIAAIVFDGEPMREGGE